MSWRPGYSLFPRNSLGLMAVLLIAAGTLAPAVGEASDGPASDTAVPTVTIRRMPTHCTVVRFTARVTIATSAPLEHARVLIDNHPAVWKRETTFIVRIDLARVSAGRHKLTVVATDSLGATASTVTHFTRRHRKRRTLPLFTG
jgi:hypothetical protein